MTEREKRYTPGPYEVSGTTVYALNNGGTNRSKKRLARRVGLPLMTMMRVIAMGPKDKEGPQ